MAYLIPTGELTLTDMKAFRDQAQEALIRRAMLKLGASRESLTIRAAQQVADFGTAADQWLTGVILAIGGLYTVFNNVANPIMANNRLAVFYKVGIETAPSPISLLWFQLGVAAGTTKAVYDTEQLVNKLEVEGYFSEPIVYDPQDVLNVRVTGRIATGLQARVQFGCLIAEPKGVTIS